MVLVSHGKRSAKPFAADKIKKNKHLKFFTGPSKENVYRRKSGFIRRRKPKLAWPPRQTFEELFDDHLCGCVQQALANAGDHSVDLNVAFLAQFGGRIRGGERPQAVALQETYFARAFDHEPELLGRLLIGDTNFSSNAPGLGEDFRSMGSV